MKLQGLGDLSSRHDRGQTFSATGGARFKRSDAIRYVQAYQKELGLSWSALAHNTGIPRTTLRRWMLEEEKSPEGNSRFTWAGALVILIIICLTPFLIMGMAVGTCYLFGRAEEARFMFETFKTLILKG